MKHRNWIPAATLGLTLLTLPALGQAEAVDGRSLHESTCMQCHAARFGGDGSAIYTRADRRVTSREGLTRQVRRCEQMLGLTWFDDQIEATAEYLNKTYYHFDTPEQSPSK